MKFSMYNASPLVVWPTIAVLSMLVIQVLLEIFLMSPLTVRLDHFRETNLPLKNSVQTQPISLPQARLDAVLNRLHDQSDNQGRIERLHQTANQHGVSLRKAIYQTQQPAGGLLLRHEVQFDLSGTYPGIRQFLRDSLIQDDALALESLEFSRPPNSLGVRAQVRLVLFSRP